MHFGIPALVFIATALAVGAVCLSYLKARFHTTDHHLMVFVLVGAIGYLAPLHMQRASQLERDRLKNIWAGSGRVLAHELERSQKPLSEISEGELHQAVSEAVRRITLPARDISTASLVTRAGTAGTYNRVTVSVALAPDKRAIAEGCNPKIEQALRDEEAWCELADPEGNLTALYLILPVRGSGPEVEGALMVQFAVSRWLTEQEMVEWRVAGEFFGLLSICLLMAGILVTTAETRRRKEMDRAVSQLKDEVESLGGMVNAVHGVVWERPATSTRFTFVSQQADGCFGYSLERWTGDSEFIQEILHKEDSERVRRVWSSAAEDCAVFHAEYRVICADGEVAHVSEHGQAKWVPMQGVIMRGILIDVTTQKNAEAAGKELHRMMVEASRQSGMAEIATGVLHNVGNVLNSLNVGAKLLLERMEKSRHDRLCQATGLLREHMPENMDFFASDARGRALPGYLNELSAYLRDEQNRLTASVRDMIERVDHIRDMIMLQQSHSKLHTLWEEVDLATVMEEAIKLEAGTRGGRETFRIERHYVDLPPMYIARGLLLQILVNLLSNASQAMAEVPPDRRRLLLRIGPNSSSGVRLVVEDNGCGIPPRNLTAVFTQGFTTKRDGHGFGLHHASLLVEDLGGTLKAESEGLGKGARFILDLPARKAPLSQDTATGTPPASPLVSNATAE